MKHINTTENNGIIKYHYTFTQLREFLTHGFKEGNNGFIITQKDKFFSTFRGFGTIEAPCKHLRTISIEDDPFFDEPTNHKPTTYKFEIWDASK